jgi:ferredoxin
MHELAHYGAEDTRKCFQCGNCTAVCTHAEMPFTFPRKSTTYIHMGLEDELKGSLEPWLCYYCGQCSEQCPRGAEPGETMMSLRRWLTAQYDFTGLSRLFYKSWKAELAAILIVAIATAIGFLTYGFAHGDIHTYDGPTAFLASSSVHLFDWGMASVLTVLIGINALRMWWFAVGRNRRARVPFLAYLTSLYVLPLQFFTQQHYADCKRTRPWFLHLVLMLSYVTMFVLIMFFLETVQAGPEINWRAHALGYFATFGLIGAVLFAIVGRLRRKETQHQHSHESDWMFLGLLLFVAGTGILQHVLHRTGQDLAANITYVVHLSGVVPMLVLEVPFSKWSHMAYRPLALYFARLLRQADAVVAGDRPQ